LRRRIAAAGIPSVIAADAAGGAYPFDLTGAARLLVDEADAEDAAEILSERHHTDRRSSRDNDVDHHSGFRSAQPSRGRPPLRADDGPGCAHSGLFALGAYIGRDTSAGWAICWFLVAFAVLLGMNAAAQRSEQLAVGLLFGFGLLLGLAVAPTVAYHVGEDPQAVWRADGGAVRWPGSVPSATRRGATSRSSPASSSGRWSR